MKIDIDLESYVEATNAICEEWVAAHELLSEWGVPETRGNDNLRLSLALRLKIMKGHLAFTTRSHDERGKPATDTQAAPGPEADDDLPA
jgi:hypothetical protein